VLDLAQRLQSADEVVMEDPEICVWFRLRLATFLLQPGSEAKSESNARRVIK
jgi:hypothetical protein